MFQRKRFYYTKEIQINKTKNKKQKKEKDL